MTGIGFTRSPAYATIGDGLSLAARYWRASWERWLLAVVAVAVVNGLAAWLLGGATGDQQALVRALLPGAGRQPLGAAELPRLLAGPLAVGIVGLVAQWFLVANAIAGLRRREVTLPWVLAAGLRAFAADLVVALTVVTVVFAALALGAFGLLVLLGAMPVLFYLAIRLQFWTLAIFDGSSVAGGARTSWDLTRNAVLRALGWGLAVFGLGLLLSVVDVAIGFVLADAPVVGSTIAGAMQTAFQAFTVVVMAVLYESQRLRSLPPAVAGYGAGPVSPPAEPRGPFDPPPPPPPSWPET